jgi:hypothetical protein
VGDLTVVPGADRHGVWTVETGVVPVACVAVEDFDPGWCRRLEQTKPVGLLCRKTEI